MVEKINNQLIQPVFPSQKIENEDDEEKRKQDRIQRIKDELEKKQKLKDNNKNIIDVVVQALNLKFNIIPVKLPLAVFSRVNFNNL